MLLAIGALLPVALALAGFAIARERLIARAARDPGPSAIRALTDHIDTWQRAARAPATAAGVVFGDSVFVHGFTDELTRTLATRAIAADVLGVIQPGFSAYQYSYVLDSVLRGRPRFAVVEVNLRTLASDWRENRALEFPHLAAGLSAERAWRVRGALDAVNIGQLDVLRYRLQERSGTLYLVDGARALCVDVFDAAGAAINRLLGLETVSGHLQLARVIGQAAFLDRERAENRFGIDFAATPGAEMLALVAADLDAAGVTTLFVVAPTDRARLAELGIPAEDLARRSDALRRRIGATPAQWLDSSSLVTNADFQDSMHVKPDAVARIAAASAQRVAELLSAGR